MPDDLSAAPPPLGRRGAAALLLAAPALIGRAWAQAGPARPSWPFDKPVRIVVPLAAGGTADFLARSLANRLQEVTGGSFVVENRTGGGGAVGWQAASRAAADGSTILVTDNSLAIAAAAERDVGLDPRKDLEPVALVAQYAPIVLVSPSLPVRDFQGFLRHAREREGRLFYGSGGTGSVPHLQAELLQSLTGIRLGHVAYRGMAQAATDLVAGQVHLILPVYPTVAGQLRSGDLRPLAVGAEEGRVPLMPEVPTLREAGVDFTHQTWFGVLAPRGTPPEAVARMQAALATAASGDEFRRRMEETGATAPPLSTAAFRHRFDEEAALWARLIRERGIRVE